MALTSGWVSIPTRKHTAPEIQKIIPPTTNGLNFIRDDHNPSPEEKVKTVAPNISFHIANHGGDDIQTFAGGKIF